MNKERNALRKHYLAPFDPENPTKIPEKSAYMWLARGLKESSPKNDENTDDYADFEGDGTPEEIVISKKRGRSFEGYRDYSDPAQNFIAGKEDEVGDDLLIWYKEISADGKTQKEGIARLSGIEIGDGEASEIETIKFDVTWNRKPTATQVVSV